MLSPFSLGAFAHAALLSRIPCSWEGDPLQVTENSAQMGFNSEAYVFVHRLGSQEVDRIHI